MGNIGLVHYGKGETNKAHKFLKDALSILDEHGFAYGRDTIVNVIAEIEAEQKGGNSTP